MIEPSPICTVCKSTEVDPFFRLSDVPVCTNVLYDTSEEARLCARGDIELGVCHSCGMITNLAFDPERIAYNPNYENSLHYSPLFQEYATKLAQRLIRDYRLQGKTIIEIGCGKGEFLALLCRMGDNRGIGFDHSYVNGRVDTDAGKGLSVIEDNFSEKYSELACDMLCCRHTLEHISDPSGFLDQIRRALGGRRIPIFFEVPDALYTLRHGGIWDVIYEHCSYFTPPSLDQLFRRSGFHVRKLREDFGGQFLCIDAGNASDVISETATPGGSTEEVAQIVEDAHALGRGFCEMSAYWKRTLHALRESGKRVVVWGAGAKGCMFLNSVGAEGIDYVVDLNSHKQGRYVPASGQRIVAPQFLQGYRPDAILIMNPIYLDEIQAQVQDMGFKTEVQDDREDGHGVSRLQLF